MNNVHANEFVPAWWNTTSYTVVDQTRLPLEYREITTTSSKELFEIIRNMKVRGAPLIGVVASAAFAFAIKELSEITEESLDDFVDRFAQARPTAINLRAALEAIRRAITPAVHQKLDTNQLFELAQDISRSMHEEDRRRNYRIGDNGADYVSTLFSEPVDILTHCNTGSLATAGYGTALGVIRSLHKRNMVRHVWVDETRPYLQGSRLTAWELAHDCIPHTIITDSTAAWLMQKKRVSLVIVGADRMAANGDFANKIGSYSLAIAARWHTIPFITALPVETIDLSVKSGEHIPIEERDETELLSCGQQRIAPSKSHGLHLGFDVVPAELLTAVITEKGVLSDAITTQAIADLCSRPLDADRVRDNGTNK